MSHNQLVALDLKREGDYRWMVGGETGLDEPQLAGAFFLGVPLPLFGQLYALAKSTARSDSSCWIRKRVARSGRSNLPTSMLRPFWRTRNAICPEPPPRSATGSSYPHVGRGGRGSRYGDSVAALGFPTHRWSPSIEIWHYASISRPDSATGKSLDGGTATIAGGVVLLTPPESSKLICLDLLTGESKWPPRERGEELGEMLYVACVHEGNAVLVGRSQVNASAGRRETGVAAAGATVAGRTGNAQWPRLLQRALLLPAHDCVPAVENRFGGGQVVEQTRTDRVLGNVICFRDHVIGQGVDGLSAYYQMGPLQQQVTERLAKSPNDAWALARRGELLLNDGNVRDALLAVRTSSS